MPIVSRGTPAAALHWEHALRRYFVSYAQRRLTIVEGLALPERIEIVCRICPLVQRYGRRAALLADRFGTEARALPGADHGGAIEIGERKGRLARCRHS